MLNFNNYVSQCFDQRQVITGSKHLGGKNLIAALRVFKDLQESTKDPIGI